MIRVWTGLVLVLAVGRLAAADPVSFPDAKHGRGELTHVNGFPVLVLRGTPTEIGEQFGVLAVKNAPGLDDLQANFLKDAKLDQRFGFIKMLARKLKTGIPPHHLAEIEAASRVSGRELDLALFANSVYDLSSGMGCSTIVVEKGRSQTGAPIFGRNFDWLPSKGIHEHSLLAVFHPEGKRSFAIVTISPIVGCISGMNEAGLSCTINEIRLRQSKEKAEFNWDGTPTLLAFRRVLEECSTVAEAEKLLRGMKRTTAACLTLCDTTGGAVFELTPRSLIVRSAVNEVCCCTNHFRSDLLGKGEKCWRYAELEPLQAGNSKLGVDEVFARLHTVNQKKLTLQSMVFEPARRVLHLKAGPGPATTRTPITFDLAKYFQN